MHTCTQKGKTLYLCTCSGTHIHMLRESTTHFCRFRCRWENATYTQSVFGICIHIQTHTRKCALGNVPSLAYVNRLIE